MLYKFYNYLRVNGSKTIMVLPLLFICLELTYVFLKGGMTYYDAVPIFNILLPIIAVNIYCYVFSREFRNDFWELISSYREKKKTIFAYKYLVILFIYLPLLIGYIIALTYNQGGGDLRHMLNGSLMFSLFIGNLSALISILSCKYEIGLMIGLVVVMVMIKISLPDWVVFYLYPVLIVLSIGLSYRIYTKMEGDLKNAD